MRACDLAAPLDASPKPPANPNKTNPAENRRGLSAVWAAFEAAFFVAKLQKPERFASDGL